MNEPDLWDQQISPALEVRHYQVLTLVRLKLEQLAASIDRPLSADDARIIAAAYNIKTGPWCGSVFKKGWRVVGWKRSEAKGRHGSTIRTYRPTREAA